MLDNEQIATLVSDMWTLHQTELVHLDRVYGYTAGQLGVPAVPEGSEQEVKDLAKLSVKNVLSLVRDSFCQNLSVVGYRNSATEENSAGWKQWQANRMDARQAEVYRPAVTYGAAYVIVTNEEPDTLWRTRSPRQLLAVYEDPQVDVWPQYAFETWIDSTDAKPHRKAVMYDDTFMYPLDLGEMPTIPVDQNATMYARAARISDFGDPVAHGASVCPVVRFVNARDADDMIVGEIAPLIRLQQAINSVNFDRLLVSRFCAFPQRVISGWSGSPSEVLKASAKRVWTFDDADVTAQAFPSADLSNYNGVLAEMLEHVAMVAQISPAQVTGKLVNLSAEALAAAEANQQRKIASKRDSFGESWEQVFRLAAAIAGDTTGAGDDESEVVWRDTEARTFAAIVDGVVKLSSAGVPIEELLTSVPGFTQQQIASIRAAIARTPEVAPAIPEPGPPSPAAMPMTRATP